MTKGTTRTQKRKNRYGEQKQEITFKFLLKVFVLPNINHFIILKMTQIGSFHIITIQYKMYQLIKPIETLVEREKH